MGKAYPTNIYHGFTRRLYAKGRLSIADSQVALSRAGEAVHAACGTHTEPYMLRMVLLAVVNYLHRSWQEAPGTKIEPVDMSDEQKRVYHEWLFDDVDHWDSGDDGNGGEYGIFDSIQWKYSKGVRRTYASLPVLDYWET
jgi:hypothetical protein